MPFGVTYATYVVAVGLAMIYGPADPAPKYIPYDVTYGIKIKPWVSQGQDKVLTLTHRGRGTVWGKFTPIYALGISDADMAFLSVGLGRSLDVFGIKVMPHAGPVLYTDPLKNDLLQFRTGFDIVQPLGDNIALTGGFYHISNGQANAASADIDVAHFGISMKF